MGEKGRWEGVLFLFIRVFWALIRDCLLLMIELLREEKHLREIVRGVAFLEQEFGDCDRFGCNIIWYLDYRMKAV